MKWIESDLMYNGELISIIGLELSESKESIQAIFSGIDDKVRTILSYHLSFDFIFMAGCYPGIACLCMMAAEKTGSKWLRRLLLFIAFLQLFAWACDVIENYYLLKRLKHPLIGSEFGFYHFLVYSKWTIAVLGIFLAAGVFVSFMFKKKNKNL